MDRSRIERRECLIEEEQQEDEQHLDETEDANRAGEKPDDSIVQDEKETGRPDRREKKNDDKIKYRPGLRCMDEEEYPGRNERRDTDKKNVEEKVRRTNGKDGFLRNG